MSQTVEHVTYVLVPEGSSDRVIIDIVDRAIREQLPEVSVHGEWLDLRLVRKRTPTLRDRVHAAVNAFPDVDFLLVHRDSDNQRVEDRRREIDNASRAAAVCSRVVPVIPVRSIEAWLLVDVEAIRIGAGNPNGKTPLTLPQRDEIERERNPKTILHQALVDASGLGHRRRSKFRAGEAMHRVARALDTVESLRHLPAYRAFEDELIATIGQLVEVGGDGRDQKGSRSYEQ